MSLARELYKTKLCNLYQRGHCPRQSCSFAHGDAELRRFPGGGGGSSFNGRRDYRGGGDLRERLERRQSPRSRRFSPGRDGRGRQGHSDRGRSDSRSPLRGKSSRSVSPPKSGQYKSERKEKRRLRLDGPDAHLSDVSEDLRGPTTWVDESPEKDAKSRSPDPKDLLEEELRDVDADIDSLNDQLIGLKDSLEKKVQEMEEVSAKNLELDSKLSKEQEDHKRLGSKMKKFVKVYMRCARAQEEVKKTQARLQKLVEEFRLGDGTRTTTHGEDSDVNIVSDGEPEQPLNNHVENEGHQITTASALAKDDSDMDFDVSEKNGGLKRKASSAYRGKSRVSKTSRPDLLETGASLKDSNADVGDWTNFPYSRLAANDKSEKVVMSLSEDLSNRARSFGGVDATGFNSVPHEKVRSWDAGISIPSTGLAAHAEDEQVETGDDDKRASVNVNFQDDTNLTVFQSLPGKSDLNGAQNFLGGLTQIPLMSSNQYAQYKGDDEEVDVEVVDDSLDNPVGINLNTKQVLVRGF